MGEWQVEDQPAVSDRTRLTATVMWAKKTRGLLTVKEAAKRGRVTPIAVYRAVATGRLSHWKVEDPERGGGQGYALMLDPEAVDQWRANSQKKTVH